VHRSFWDWSGVEPQYFASITAVITANMAVLTLRAQTPDACYAAYVSWVKAWNPMKEIVDL
jgi:hypothetical protein